MPLLDLLTGGGNSTTGGTTGSTTGGTTGSNIVNTLTGLAKKIFPALGGILSGVINAINPGCWGGQAIPKTMVEEHKKRLESFANEVASNPSNLVPATAFCLTTATESHSFKWQADNTLKNACSKSNARSISDLYKKFGDELRSIYNGYDFNTTYVQGSAGNMTITVFKPTGYKIPVSDTPPVVETPTTPTLPPAPTTPTSPPVQTPAPPVYYPPTTNVPTTNTPVVTYSNSGVTGLGTEGTYLPTTTTSLTGGTPIQLGGTIGDWTFGTSNNQNQTLYLVGGAVGLGALFLILNKKK